MKGLQIKTPIWTQVISEPTPIRDGDLALIHIFCFSLM